MILLIGLKNKKKSSYLKKLATNIKNNPQLLSTKVYRV
jgi:hypothetical protein